MRSPWATPADPRIAEAERDRVFCEVGVAEEHDSYPGDAAAGFVNAWTASPAVEGHDRRP